MDNNTGSKLFSIKTFLAKYYLVLRYIYPVLLVLGTVFSITGAEFINKEIEHTVLIIYYALGIASSITIFTNDITAPELLIMLMYPVLMALSPVPFETCFIIVMLIAVILKYKKEFKALFISCFVICILIGILIIPISIVFRYLVTDTIISCDYSNNGKYTVEICYTDQGALGVDLSANLYRVYSNTLRTHERRLYTGKEAIAISWIDNNHVKINESIIDIDSNETYN